MRNRFTVKVFLLLAVELALLTVLILTGFFM